MRYVGARIKWFPGVIDQPKSSSKDTTRLGRESLQVRRFSPGVYPCGDLLVQFVLLNLLDD